MNSSVTSTKIHPDSLEIKYYNALVDKLHRQDEAANAP